jgi:hypothetical protein
MLTTAPGLGYVKTRWKRLDASRLGRVWPLLAVSDTLGRFFPSQQGI